VSVRPLSILAVTLRYPPYVAGGYELLTRDAVETLRERGHRVRVLCGAGARLAGAEDVLPWLAPGLDGEEDLFERSFRASNAERLRLHVLRLANYRATRRALVGADVLLFFNLGMVSLAPVLAARHARVPTLGFLSDAWPANHWVLSWRERAPDSLRLALLERFWRGFRELVDLGPLLACSAYLARRLAGEGLPGIEVAHLGVPRDVERAAAGHAAAGHDGPRARASNEPLRVLCTSSLWEGKGQDVLLAAAARALELGAELELVLAAGSARPEFRARLEALAAPLGGRVAFRERLPRAELLDELARAHVLVLPSTWGEPFALAVLEGLALGLAVVASDAGGSPEALRDGVDGRITPAGDVEALARALADLARDEPRRLALARAGQARARELAQGRFVERLELGLARARGEAPLRAGVAH